MLQNNFELGKIPSDAWLDYQVIKNTTTARCGGAGPPSPSSWFAWPTREFGLNCRWSHLPILRFAGQPNSDRNGINAQPKIINELVGNDLPTFFRFLDADNTHYS